VTGAASSVSLDVIASEVKGLGRDEGLIPAKLEGTQLLSLARFPAGWTLQARTEALRGLIIEVVSKIQNEKPRSAARAAMMLDPAYASLHSAADRWKAMAASRGAHADTIRQGWWGEAVRMICRMLPPRILELNENPSAWQGYTTSDGQPEDDIPAAGYYLEQVDVAWLLRDRAVIELLTYRTLVAMRDGIGSYQSRAWYFSDPDPDKYEVVPVMNCAVGRQEKPGSRGLLLTDLMFPHILDKGDQVFFAYKVLIHSDKPSEQVFRHEVRSDGVGLLIFRVQFDPAAPPGLVWHFASPDDADPYVRPAAGSSRYLRPTALGYVEHRFRRCQHGTKYGIAWAWPDD
jgi:hypothetical protein